MGGFLLAIALACCETPADRPASYLYQPAYTLDEVCFTPAEPYVPQPGDIFMATDQALWAQAGHWLAGGRGLHHSGIVFARSDGRPALIESGPFNSVKIEVLDPYEHMHNHVCAGDRVYIRKRRCPLTPAQSAALTAFLEPKDGMPFAIFRLMRQVTPFRTRGPIRLNFMGYPHGERDKYFCAELVMEACVAAGLLDAATTRPSATYPRDIFFGHSINPYLDKHLPLEEAGWCPPARWTESPIP